MKETLHHIRQALAPLYPPHEVESLVRLLFRHVCNYRTAELFLYKDTTLSPTYRTSLAAIVTRLQVGEPVQYVLGSTTFHDLEFQLPSGSVLIPRPETEELTELILSHPPLSPTPRILDVGTGSGCIAITLAHRWRNAVVEACDLSPEALKAARANAEQLGVEVLFRRMDALAPWAAECQGYDLIVSNPPYICEEERSSMEAHVLDYEPHMALFVPDNDPLRFYRAIAQEGIARLNPAGRLYFEINRRFATETVAMLSDLGYVAIEVGRDLFGNDRFVWAEKPHLV